MLPGLGDVLGEVGDEVQGIEDLEAAAVHPGAGGRSGNAGQTLGDREDELAVRQPVIAAGQAFVSRAFDPARQPSTIA